MLNRAEEKLADARCLLLSSQPVYGFAALNIIWRPSTEVETMGVRLIKGFQFECIYNIDFVLSLDLYELAFVICHEIEHIVRAHCIRRYDVDSTLYNIACDYTIHGHKSKPKIGLSEEQGERVRIPLEDQICWIPDNWNPNLTAEEYYALLVDNANDNGKPIDDHTVWDSDLPVEEVERAISDYIRSVQSQSTGIMPGHWKIHLTETITRTVPWNVLLRRFISNLSRKRTSTLRRSRRRDIFGAPGKVRQNNRRVTVVVDVSGSVSESLLEKFFGELDSCTDHAQLDLLLWDSAFQGFYKDYKSKDWRERVKLTGRGGTDMAAPIVWLNEKGIRSDCRIIFTDGYCNWQKKEDTKIPTIALIYGKSEMSTGGRWSSPEWIQAIHMTN